MRAAQPPEARRAAASLGRYRILDELGRGGMGVVYAAWDPELDRTVALKVLRSRKGDPAAAARLLREAQALARLSHPNVVQIYDVDTVADEIFIAMERVEGETLGDWLAAQPRAWRDVVAVFRAAGEGLAAAHSANLVHRDFKPANVLLGRDGRVRVADFGVARFVRAEATDGSGNVVGTPRYIAPELLRGQRADPRSDQFSYCVALHEALYGQPPFEGRGLGELAAEAEAGAVRPAPAGSEVPDRLRRLLLRGLRADPSLRYASMPDLLDALERVEPLAARKWLRLGALALALGVAAGGVLVWRARRSALCSGGVELVARVWNDARRAQLRGSFSSSARPYAADAAARAVASLDAFAASWASAHREACVASRLRGEQSEDLLDRRMACLDRQLADFDALTEVLATATPDVVERGAQAAAALPRLEECADLAALTGPLPLPDDPSSRAAAARLASPLARAKALQAAGRYAEGLEIARQTVEQAAAAGHSPLLAEALRLRGALEELSGEPAAAEATLSAAFAAAQRGRDDRLAARIASELAWVVGYRQLRFDEGRRWAEIAAGAIERLGGASDLTADLDGNLSGIEDLAGDQEKALALQRRALEFFRGAFGPDHPGVGRSLNRLGSVLYNSQRYEEALPVFQEAQEHTRRTLGGAHPTMSVRLNNVALTLEALGYRERAIAVQREAMAIEERALGAEHPQFALSLANLGEMVGAAGDWNAARDLLRRALDIQERALGAESADAAVTRNSFAEALARSGARREALLQAQRAVRDLEAALGEDHAWTGAALYTEGAVWLQLGDAAAAVTRLRRAMPGVARREGPASQLPGLQFALARATAASGGDPRAAVALAREARAGYAALAAREPQDATLREIDAWLAALAARRR